MKYLWGYLQQACRSHQRSLESVSLQLPRQRQTALERLRDDFRDPGLFFVSFSFSFGDKDPYGHALAELHPALNLPIDQEQSSACLPNLQF